MYLFFNEYFQSTWALVKVHMTFWRKYANEVYEVTGLMLKHYPEDTQHLQV